MYKGRSEKRRCFGQLCIPVLVELLLLVPFRGWSTLYRCYGMDRPRFDLGLNAKHALMRVDTVFPKQKRADVRKVVPFSGKPHYYVLVNLQYIASYRNRGESARCHGYSTMGGHSK